MHEAAIGPHPFWLCVLFLASKLKMRGNVGWAAAIPTRLGAESSQSTPPEGTVCFEDIIAAERKAIAERRGYVKRTKTEAGQGEGGDPADPSTNVVKPFSRFGAPVGETDDLIQDTIGLSLSGGGIRSAAFCLGVLQALDLAQVLDKVDYLSSVSGGGYIGLSMRAAMIRTAASFAFPSRLKRDQVLRSSTPATPQLSLSRRTFDFLRNAAIYASRARRQLHPDMILLLAAALDDLVQPHAMLSANPIFWHGATSRSVTFGGMKAALRPSTGEVEIPGNDER